MKLKARLHPVKLQLKEPFTISRGTYSERFTLLVELRADGLSGFGEATQHDYYGITEQQLLAEGEKLQQLLPEIEFENPFDFWQALDPHFGHNRFFQSAVDVAAHDLYGKLLGKPVRECWPEDLRQWMKPPEQYVPSTYTLGIGSREELERKIAAQPDFQIYKIKAGKDFEPVLLSALRQMTEARFCIDANNAWDVEQALALLPELHEAELLFLEQPLPAGEREAMARLYEASPLPLIADEACRTPADVPACAGRFHGINIKLMKCGGLTPALDMLRLARQYGLQLMVGCMVETGIGISAAAQLLPFLDYADLDGAVLLAENPWPGVELTKTGQIVLSDRPGIGLTAP